MQKLGEYLKHQREEKGIRLEEIASITKIHLHSLQMLEQSNWEELPPEPFIRGFITAYAKYVGVNPSDALERYNHETLKTPESASESVRATVPADASPGEIMEKSGPSLDWKLGAVAALFVVIVAIGAFIYIGKQSEGGAPEQAKNEAPEKSTELSKDDLTALVGKTDEEDLLRDKENPPEVSVPVQAPPQTTKKEEPAKVAKTNPVVVPTAATTPTPTPVRENASQAAHSVSVKGGERSWIKVVIDDKEPVEYFLPAGKLVTYEAASKIKVVLGNATGAEVSYNGQTTTGVKYRSGVHAFIFPKDSKFPQDVPPRNTAEESDKSDDEATESETGLDLEL